MLTGQKGFCYGLHTPVPTPHHGVASPSHFAPLCLSFLLCKPGLTAALLCHMWVRVTEGPGRVFQRRALHMSGLICHHCLNFLSPGERDAGQ